MYKYRVIGYKTTGNGRKLYEIEDLVHKTVFEEYAKFFYQEGDDAFINVSVRGKSRFSILKADKGSEEYHKNQNRVLSRMTI